MPMSGKVIDEYFKRWLHDIDKAAELLDTPRFFLEGVLVLSCYLGAFAAMRFPALRDGEAYVSLVLEYSGRRAFYEQIDLLFFLQWPRSKLAANGTYKELRNHSDITAALEQKYGKEDKIRDRRIYLAPSDVLNVARAASISGYDEGNLVAKLPLFSLVEILYRYMRCDAVHSAEYSLFNEAVDVEDNITYGPNHAITDTVLLDTTRNVAQSLWTQCQREKKWPYEL